MFRRSSSPPPPSSLSLSGAPLVFDPPLAGCVLKVGLLSKLGHQSSRWQVRLCVLTDHGDLTYFDPGDSPASKVCHTRKQLKGKVNCREAVSRTRDVHHDQAARESPSNSPRGGTGFTIQPASSTRRYEFLADTMAARDDWLALLARFGDAPATAPAHQPTAKAREILFGSGGHGGRDAHNHQHHPSSQHGQTSAADTSSASTPSAGAPPATGAAGGGVGASSMAPGHSHKELRMLGMSEQAYDKFHSSAKAYAKLGAGLEGHALSREERHSVAHSSAVATAAATSVAGILSARAAQPSPPAAPTLSPSLGVLAGGGSVYTCGLLWKLGGGARPQWQPRYFILTAAGILHYWKDTEILPSSSSSAAAGVATSPVHIPPARTKGTLDANRSQIRLVAHADQSYASRGEPPPPTSHVLTFHPLGSGAKTYALCAATWTDVDHWVAALSFFGEGPTSPPTAQRVSAKAKDVLFGGQKHHAASAAAATAAAAAQAAPSSDSTSPAAHRGASPPSTSRLAHPHAAVLDRLGTTQKTLDTFVGVPKAFARLGLFDEESRGHPVGRRASTSAQEVTDEPAGAVGPASDVTHAHAQSSFAVARYNLHGNLVPPSMHVFAGALAKQGGRVKTVRTRWFVLVSSAAAEGGAESTAGAPTTVSDLHSLFYYADASAREPKGEILLAAGTRVEPTTIAHADAHFPCAFTVTPGRAAHDASDVDRRAYVLFAPNVDTRRQWIEKIQGVLANLEAAASQPTPRR